MIEYIDVEVTLPPPVKKQIWNGEKFVPMTLYRTSKKLTHDQIDWLRATYACPECICLDNIGIMPTVN